MKYANPSRGWSASKGGRQRGQALLFGLFILAGGLAALFFLFNAGQLIQEKDKLTTTADAVAYSASVMNARALNFTAYTNRALVANEVAVAQIVSVASWSRYIDQHAQVALSFGCSTIYNLPAGMTMTKYAPLCMGLAWSAEYTAQISDWVVNGASAAVTGIEAAKLLLRGAQWGMMGALAFERSALLNDVASANYRGDGSVRVDPLPLEDGFYNFDNTGPILTQRSGNDRQRLASVALAAANRDGFVPSRHWSDKSLLPSCIGSNGWRFNQVDRNGGTGLNGLDEWSAGDSFSLTTWRPRGWLRRCRASSATLAEGSQTANPRGRSSTTNWRQYSGLPTYFDLSNRALSYTPENADVNRRDPRVRFSIRVTRNVDQAMTSQGRSDIKSSPGGGVYGLNQYSSNAARGVYAAVATSEVFFERPAARADGRREIANVFNPYWQAHLVETSTGIMTMARALQGVAF